LLFICAPLPSKQNRTHNVSVVTCGEFVSLSFKFARARLP
jgi:hypothetical protein